MSAKVEKEHRQACPIFIRWVFPGSGLYNQRHPAQTYCNKLRLPPKKGNATAAPQGTVLIGWMPPQLRRYLLEGGR